MFEKRTTTSDKRSPLPMVWVLLLAVSALGLIAQDRVGPPCQTAQLEDPNSKKTSLFGGARFDGAFTAVSDGGEHTVSIFRYTGSEWTPHTTLTPNAPPDEPTQFGFIAMDGHVLAVGDDQPIGNGSVAIYRFENGAWNFEQEIFAQDVEAPQAEVFGRHLDIHDDRLIVGNANSGVQDPVVPGTAFIFRHNGAEWELETQLDGPQEIVSNSYGKQVVILDDLAFVSDTNIDQPGIHPNTVFVYRYEQNTWLLQQHLSPVDTSSPIGFGLSMAVNESGDTLVIGAPQDLTQQGSAYVYRHNGNKWVFEQKLTASELFSAFAFPGHDVAINGPGDCGDESCSMTVCEQHAFCCETAWGTRCVNAAKRMCDVCE